NRRQDALLETNREREPRILLRPISYEEGSREEQNRTGSQTGRTRRPTEHFGRKLFHRDEDPTLLRQGHFARGSSYSPRRAYHEPRSTIGSPHPRDHPRPPTQRPRYRPDNPLHGGGGPAQRSGRNHRPGKNNRARPTRRTQRIGDEKRDHRHRS